MKKKFAMSLFALSTVTMFGGSIEKKPETKSIETEEQVVSIRCYNFKVYIEKVKNFIPTNFVQLMYEESGYHTVAGALQRGQELAVIYQSSVNEWGSGAIYTYENSRCQGFTEPPVGSGPITTTPLP